MIYEVLHETAHYVEAGNPYQACLHVLREEAEQDNIRMEPFTVSRNGESEDIPMELVLGIQSVALNGEEHEGKDAIGLGQYMEW